MGGFAFGAGFYGQYAPDLGSIVVLPTPAVLALTGIYAPTLTLTATYAPAVRLTGTYAPTLTLTGETED